MMNKKLAMLVAGVILTVGGLIPTIALTFSADPANPYTIGQRTLVASDGTRIASLIFTPTNTSGNHPGVVVAHGFCGNKQYMQPLSIELVKRGFVVVAIDFRGHGISDGYMLGRFPTDDMSLDIGAAVGYLQGLGYVDKIGLVGHSMGGRTSLVYAEAHSDIINATVSLGMVSMDFNWSRIPNLMMAIGQFEQTFTRQDAIDFVRAYTGNASAETGLQYGSFAAMNATKAVIGPTSEHLGDVFEPTIMHEMVSWLELAFFGSIRWPVNITITILVGFIITMLAGCAVVFAAITAYFSKLIVKRPASKETVALPREFSAGKMVGFFIIGSVVGLGLISPLSSIFTVTIPVVMGNSLYAMLAGRAIAVLIAFVLFKILYRKQWKAKTLYVSFKEFTLPGSRASIVYGLATGLVFCAIFIIAMDWSITAAIPTTREFGAMWSIAVLSFPPLIVKEYYVRTIQSRITWRNKAHEFFSMAGIGILLDNTVLIPVMLVTWGTDWGAFLALSTSVFVFFSALQQTTITWVYMFSRRNILSSTMFACIQYAWMAIIFYPFGLSFPLL
nr:alpha/beta fold hydrolase [Candidatus Sigynarchaeota archaeon]